MKCERLSLKTTRSMSTGIFCFFMCIALTVSILGTAQAQSEENARYSGFLGDYSDLEPLPGGDNMLVFRSYEGALRPYTKFIIDPVLIFFSEGAAADGVDPQELLDLATYFREQAVEELSESGRYEIVDTAGPGVLRVRAALTNVKSTGRTANTVVKAAGVTAAAVTVPGVGLFVPRVDLGEVSIEVDMLDSETEERVVALVDTRQGRRFFSFIRGLKAWGDVEAAFRSWAEQFRETLDRVHSQ